MRAYTCAYEINFVPLRNKIDICSSFEKKINQLTYY